VVTSISWTHTEFLGDIDGVACEKGKLIGALPKNGWQVLNFDDPRARDLEKICQAQTFFFGLDKKNCHLWAENLNPSDKGISFKLVYPKNNEETPVDFPILGRHNVYTALAAAAVGLISGLSLKEIKAGLEKLTPQPSRLNMLRTTAGLVIIDDSYNASPVGVIAALQTLAEFPGQRKIAVLGEMKELGQYHQTGHEKVGETFADLNLDFLICLGQKTSPIVSAALRRGVKKENACKAESIYDAISILKKIGKKGDVILVKGSRFAHMERVVVGLQKDLGCQLLTCRRYQSCVNCQNLG
jgi:UDP-N-acetylmuramoyl-tripeptide--D-alanyl-D-alanine ligase